MQLNQAQREVTLKLVYYGPGLSGKTTNLQWVHSRAREASRGRLLTVETHDDRTLFFDLLPVFFSTEQGFKIKVKLFTVPGQVVHNATRRIVLQGADGVAFIADGRRSGTLENNRYWRNLHDNMKEIGVAAEEVPTVIQYNKLDLPDARTPEELEATRKKGKEPVVGAVAIRGDGVLETLHALLTVALQDLESRAHLSKTLGMGEGELIRCVFETLDTRGTALEKKYPPRAEGGAR